MTRRPFTSALLVGLILAVVVNGALTFKSLHEIQASRHNSILLSCREGNDRHAQAKVFVAQLVAKTPKAAKPQTAAQRKRQAEVTELFLEAIAPKYNCASRLKKFTQP